MELTIWLESKISSHNQPAEQLNKDNILKIAQTANMVMPMIILYFYDYVLFPATN